MKTINLDYKDLVYRLFIILREYGYSDPYISSKKVEQFGDILSKQVENNNKLKLTFNLNRDSFQTFLGQSRDLFTYDEETKCIYLNEGKTEYNLYNRMRVYPNEVINVFCDKRVEMNALSLFGYGAQYFSCSNTCQDYVDMFSDELIKAINAGDKKNASIYSSSIIDHIGFADYFDEPCICPITVAKTEPHAKTITYNNACYKK